MTRKPRTAKQRLELFNANGGMCHLCGGKIEAGQAWELDHVNELWLSDDDSDEIDRSEGSNEGYALMIIDKFRAGVCQDVLVRKELSFSRFKTHVPGY